MYLKISAAEHAFVQHQGLGNKVRFRKLHVGVSIERQGSI